MPNLRIEILSAWAIVGCAVAASAQKTPPVPTYIRDIRPVLTARCVVCHNRDSVSNLATSGGLDLETLDALKRGVVGKDGSRSIIVTGKAPGGSLIDRLMTTSPTRMMPRGGPQLSPTQISMFKQWLAAGAPAGSGVILAGHSSVVCASRMPAVVGSQSILFSTLLKASPEMAPNPKPKDLRISFGLKVGPVAPVTALAYSPDGAVLAVGGYRALTLWSTKTAQPVACVTHLSGPVQTIAFKPDGTQIAVGGGLAGTPGVLRIFDAKSLVPVGDPIKGHAEVVLSIAWSPDGSRLASGSQDRSARVWQWPGGKELQNFKDHGDAVTRVVFSPDGKSLYTASLDHNLRRFDLDKGVLLRTYTGHSEGINALAISTDGKRLVSSGTEPILKWWNAETGDITNNAGGHGGPVSEIVLSHDGKVVVSVSADKMARVWDAGSTGPQRALEGSSDWLYAAAISPDSKFTAAAGTDGVVRIWETANGRLRLNLLSWPLDKMPLPMWAAVTPEGYFDASPEWLTLLTPQIGDSKAGPQLSGWVKTLHQTENITKAIQGLPLEPAKPAAQAPH